jgi:hypothetical protein
MFLTRRPLFSLHASAYAEANIAKVLERHVASRIHALEDRRQIICGR